MASLKCFIQTKQFIVFMEVSFASSYIVLLVCDLDG